LLALLATAACATTTSPTSLGATLPRMLALVCLIDGKARPLVDPACSDAQLRVVVGGGNRGTLSVAVPSARTWLDFDKAVPGFTGLRVPGLPTAATVDADADALYVVLAAPAGLARLSAAQVASGSRQAPAGREAVQWAPLNFVPTDLQVAAGALWLTDPEHGRLWRLDPAACPPASALASCPWQALDLGGSPRAVAGASGKVYVGHARSRYVSVLDPSGKQIRTVSTGSACSDGLDNDADGLADRLDPGCADPNDDDEASPQLPAACADGLDEDQDGATDFPADPGCNGYGDDTEEGPPASANACANGVDDDGDGQTDLADSNCFNRLTAQEAGADDGPAMQLTATFDGRYVVASDKPRRELLVIDTADDTLQPADTAHFVRPSTLAVAAGERGLALPGLPFSLTAVRYDNGPAVAVAVNGAGLLVVQLQTPEAGLAAGTTQIGLLSAGAGSQKLTAASRPTLSLAGAVQELSPNAPDRLASFGPLVSTTNYGVQFTADDVPASRHEQRSETWRFEYEGLLAGTARDTGTLAADGTLRDGGVDFCATGVLTNDWLLVQVPACQGQPARTLRWRIAEVGAEQLALDPSAVVDAPVPGGKDADGHPLQAGWQPPTTTIPLAEALACAPTGALRYEVRARDWLVSASRSGLWSSRPSYAGVCEARLGQAQARMTDLLPPGETGAGLEPPSCPLTEAAKSAADCPAPPELPAGVASRFYRNPVLCVALRPGCLRAKGTTPARLLPTPRGLTWVYPVTSGFVPRTSEVGAAPLAGLGGPHLKQVYVIDQGLSALYAIEVASGIRVPGDVGPLQ
jgi:hypothetical protein